jgi:uncharacterized membrane protein
MDERKPDTTPSPFSAADLGALAHLYRGELYRSTVWRARFDATTNWAVVTTGLALSLTFSSEFASPLPLVLAGLLVTMFVAIEARRYRFFDVWRLRAQILEVHFYGPMLRGQGVPVDNRWNEILYQDYRTPNLHISVLVAAGRRLRRNYGWLFAIQLVAYLGKLLIHPVPIVALDDLWTRASIGPLPGPLVLLAGLGFHATWLSLAVVTYRSRRGAEWARPPRPRSDRVLELARRSAP